MFGNETTQLRSSYILGGNDNHFVIIIEFYRTMLTQQFHSWVHKKRLKFMLTQQLVCKYLQYLPKKQEYPEVCALAWEVHLLPATLEWLVSQLPHFPAHSPLMCVGRHRSTLQTGPAPAGAAVWGMNQRVEDLSFCLSPFLSLSSLIHSLCLSLDFQNKQR